MGSTDYQRLVRAAMRGHGDTERTMAKKLGVSQGTTHDWLAGTLPRGVRLARLAEYVGVSADRLAEVHAGTVEAPAVPPDVDERLAALEATVRDQQRTLAALNAAVAQVSAELSRVTRRR